MKILTFFVPMWWKRLYRNKASQFVETRTKDTNPSSIGTGRVCAVFITIGIASIVAQWLQTMMHNNVATYLYGSTVQCILQSRSHCISVSVYDNHVIVSQSPMRSHSFRRERTRWVCWRTVKKNRADFLCHWSLKTINFIVHLGNRARICFILVRRFRECVG